MVIEQDYLYWSLIEQLVVKQKYTILALSQDGREVLLEPFRNKQFTIVRLRRMDVDWGNTLTIDIERASQKFKQLLKNGVKGPIRVMNIYVSSLPPVDDLPDSFSSGYSELNGKIDITSTLLVKNECEEGLQKLESVLNIQFEDVHEQLKPNIEMQDIQHLRNRVIQYHNQQREEERRIFQNGKPFLTYIFLGLQILMFLLLELSGGSTNTETLIRFGAKFNPLIYDGEWWRFLAPIVLHIGFLHLLMNSFALYYIGPAVERAYGSLRFLFIYLVAGISGTVVSFAFSPFLSAGASGAIFGCFGALLYIGVQNRKVFFRTMGSNLLVIIGINLAMGFVIPNIDNAGHIGGLVGGFLAALIVQLPKQKQVLLRLVGLVATIFLMIGLYRYGIGHAEVQYSEYTIVKGQELIQAEKYEEAYSYLNEAINGEKTSNDHLFLLSVAEIELKKYDQAIHHLQQIISTDDTYHQAHYNLAVLYANGGDMTLAKEAVGKALEHDPTNETYQAFRNQLIN
ncbi:rhomboid family intramembrane serine protease [Metabacillus rhizolycopersici]|uniref:Rhomboid family intramembrane serine protease n=1 Tax=Metabacillus rhizolycopersici TaxID=2875709 RepID=A0ABS7UN60_9BACI|nr:rhomboid family intramembrane serine protease [Metabacillus rhizolycopersici]MBZ5749738.1 rhomboid family intramembrane serine protease [Metabacillus rhizolycopersici]